MKENTILPTDSELEAVAMRAQITEPRQAIIVNFCLTDSEESKAVFKRMKEADDYFLRLNIARDIVAAYCNKKNIKFVYIRISYLTEYDTDFSFEALIV